MPQCWKCVHVRTFEICVFNIVYMLFYSCLCIISERIISECIKREIIINKVVRCETFAPLIFLASYPAPSKIITNITTEFLENYKYNARCFSPHTLVRTKLFKHFSCEHALISHLTWRPLIIISLTNSVVDKSHFVSRTVPAGLTDSTLAENTIHI